MATSSDKADWDDRQLCPDGNCIGVINAEGLCGVCGRAAPNWGDERRRGLRSTDEVAPVVEAAVIQTSTPAAPDDFDERTLCPDGACVGLIGANGVCNVCGRAKDQ